MHWLLIISKNFFSVELRLCFKPWCLNRMFGQAAEKSRELRLAASCVSPPNARGQNATTIEKKMFLKYCDFLWLWFFTTKLYHKTYYHKTYFLPQNVFFWFDNFGNKQHFWEFLSHPWKRNFPENWGALGTNGAGAATIFYSYIISEWWIIDWYINFGYKLAKPLLADSQNLYTIRFLITHW